MAALVEGQQYGLSAQDKINCTKSLVFVKLTDSALRSLEEYVKNKGDRNSRPTIQFQNSNGVISLPQNGNSQTYGFTLSNVEADGPHGSFECLRQTGHRSLESLGCLQVKMHIHANEDSYENTRVKMAAVEKEHKMACTKVIKPAGAHLGRKVKVKRPGLVVSPIKSSPPTASMVTKPLVKPAQSREQQSITPTINLPVRRPEIPKPSPAKKNPELIRQPIRDRIIHILAVRPYKRPELLVRLNHEGVREKDKNKLTSILPQLSVLKGNIYYLANYLWNEVQDNWKFSTQEELEIIRKRKQQHLNQTNESETPPPPPTTQSSSSPLQKRIAPEVMTNGNPRSKKPRISHYKGDLQRSSYNSYTSDGPSRKTPYSPILVQPTANGAYHEDDSQRSPIGSNSDSYQSSKGDTDVYPAPNPRVSNGETFLSSGQAQRRGNREENEKSIRNHVSGLGNSTRARSHSPPMLSSSDNTHPDSYSKSSVNSDAGKTLSHPRLSSQVSPDSQYAKVDACSKTVASNGYVNSTSIKNGYGNQSSYVNRSKVTSTTNGSCSNSPHSSCDSGDSIGYNDFPTESPSQCDSPEYEKEYSRIVSSEQRARYKAQFNAEYEDYLRLHKGIINISRQFTNLERLLKKSKEGSEEHKKIRNKIYSEYKSYQHNQDYNEDLKKFNFLHSKLAYIKRLVTEYDTAQCVRS